MFVVRGNNIVDYCSHKFLLSQHNKSSQLSVAGELLEGLVELL